MREQKCHVPCENINKNAMNEEIVVKNLQTFNH